MISPVRIGLIGVGGGGQQHLRCIEQLEREKLLVLVATADPGGSAQLVETKTALINRGVHWYSSLLEMLDQEAHLDAVVVAAPIPFHEQMTQVCLERNLFVLLEKPPVVLLRELEELLNNKMETRVAVAFQMICSRETRQLKSWIVDGKLGEILEIRAMACWPRTDGYYDRASWAGKMTVQEHPVFDGPSTNGLAHLVHSAMFFAGEGLTGFAEPVQVQGELYRARPIEGHDVASVQGRFASGATFLVSVAHATKELQPIEIEIRGSRGWARISSADTHLVGELKLESQEGVYKDFAPDSNDAFLNLYYDFLEFVKGMRRSPATCLSDTRGYLLATNGALISSAGIHSIDPNFVREYGSGMDRGFSVNGLIELVRKSFQTGHSFSELGVPWGVRSNPTSREDVTKAALTFADLKRWGGGLPRRKPPNSGQFLMNPCHSGGHADR